MENNSKINNKPLGYYFFGSVQNPNSSYNRKKTLGLFILASGACFLLMHGMQLKNRIPFSLGMGTLIAFSFFLRVLRGENGSNVSNNNSDDRNSQKKEKNVLSAQNVTIIQSQSSSPHVASDSLENRQEHCPRDKAGSVLNEDDVTDCSDSPRVCEKYGLAVVEQDAVPSNPKPISIRKVILSHRFHQQLERLVTWNVSVDITRLEILCSKPHQNQEGKISKDSLELILFFLVSNLNSYMKERDCELLLQLGQKLSLLTDNSQESNKVTRIFKEFCNDATDVFTDELKEICECFDTLYSEKEIIVASLNSKENSPLSILYSYFNELLKKYYKSENIPEIDSFSIPNFRFKVSPAPDNPAAFFENLSLIVNEFPKYQFDEQLAVYDTSFDAKIPIKGHAKYLGMLKQLTEQLATYRKTLKLKNTDDATLGQVDLNVNQLLDTLKLKRIVFLQLLVDTSTAENGALNPFLAMSSGNPAIMTQSLFHLHLDVFSRFVSDYKYEIYVQKKGGLLLLLPKNSNPIDFGFPLDTSGTQSSLTSDPLTKWNGEMSDIPQRKLSFLEDLKNILLDDREDRKFVRVVAWNGHGWYPGTKQKYKKNWDSLICGVSAKLFQEGLKILHDKHTVFLSLTACYLGGRNSLYMKLPDGTLPFPIYAGSSSESVGSQHNLDYNKYKTIIKSLFQGVVYKGKLQFSYGKVKALTPQFAKSLGYSSDSPSIYLPSKEKTIPNSPFLSRSDRISYKIPFLPTLFEHDKDKKLHKASKQTWEIHEHSLFISSPVIPHRIDIEYRDSNPLGFCSRGGNSHHLISGISFPKAKFEETLECTFNLFKAYDFAKKAFIHHDEPAHKVFALGTFTCLYHGKIQQLENVVIKNFPNEREVLFKLPDMDSYTLMRFYPKDEEDFLGNWTHDPKVTLLEPLKAIYYMFQAFVESTPSPEELSQWTGGRMTDRDFYEAVRSIFWKDEPPFQVSFLESLISDQKIFTAEALVREGLKKEVRISS